MRQKLSEISAWATYTVGVLLVGGAILERSVYIENWFHDMPGSLEATQRFLAVRDPGDFFQVIVALVLLFGLIATALSWNRTRIRNALLTGLLLLVIAQVLTFILVYPQIRTLLVGDLSQKALPELQSARESFLFWGFWIRVPPLLITVFGFFLYAARQTTVRHRTPIPD